MTEVIGAAEVSGDQSEGNHKFMSIVICTKEQINSIERHLSGKRINIHAAKTNRLRQKIADELIFDRRNSIAFCIRMDRKSITKIMKTKKPKMTRIEILYQMFNRIVFRQIRDEMMDFLISHKCDLGDIAFQTDGDCREFFKDNGLARADPGTVHILADVVAWLNNHGRELDGIRSRNVADKIKDRLLK